MAKTKKYSVADDLIFKGNLGSTQKKDNSEKMPASELKSEKIEITGNETKIEDPVSETNQAEQQNADKSDKSADLVSKRWESTQKEKPSNPGGRPRVYATGNKVIKNGKVDDKESYYSVLVKFPKSIEEPMKILAIKEKYRGGITEYVNHVVIEDLKKRGMI